MKRALDIRIAEEVMGWTELDNDSVSGRAPANQTPWPGQLQPLPEYSTDIKAAWQVVERVTRIPRTLEEAERAAGTRFMFWWEKANLWAYSEAEAAEAICQAALVAVGAEEEL